jgi:hypothetical protein
VRLSLQYAGLALLAVSAWGLIAIEAGWFPSSLPEQLIPMLAGAGVVLIGVGMLLAAIGSLGQKVRRGRCARCGAKIQRGQSYCMDHLKEAVNEFQENARRSEMYRPGRRI